MGKNVVTFLFCLMLSSCVLNQPEPVSNAELQLTFTGDECIFEGPTLLKSGPASLTFYNNGEIPAAVNFLRLLKGRTIKDVLKDFNGGDKPITSHANLDEVEELGTWKYIQTGRSHTWEGDLVPGEYVMVCGRATGSAYFGAGLEVVE